MLGSFRHTIVSTTIWAITQSSCPKKQMHNNPTTSDALQPTSETSFDLEPKSVLEEEQEQKLKYSGVVLASLQNTSSHIYTYTRGCQLFDKLHNSEMPRTRGFVTQAVSKPVKEE
ncbi:hypothetical protein Fot_08606 [Forsythia ovata]|uniref:Uncharacterized protein n=1 Tax=Forsythia ovata TaxID=205694 RepID=A0ABD1WZM2_9LAMI